MIFNIIEGHHPSCVCVCVWHHRCLLTKRNWCSSVIGIWIKLKTYRYVRDSKFSPNSQQVRKVVFARRVCIPSNVFKHLYAIAARSAPPRLHSHARTPYRTSHLHCEISKLPVMSKTKLCSFVTLFHSFWQVLWCHQFTYMYAWVKWKYQQLYPYVPPINHLLLLLLLLLLCQAFQFLLLLLLLELCHLLQFLWPLMQPSLPQYSRCDQRAVIISQVDATN